MLIFDGANVLPRPFLDILLESSTLIASFGEGPDGELYVLSYGGSGTLYRVSAAAGAR